MSNISLVIPYFNEEETLNSTFNLIIKQTLLPKEVIFVNSNSNDKSYVFLNNLITDYNGGIIFKNFDTNLNTPSASKNFGIKNCSSKYIAFMDCDMIFDTNWLYDQYNFIKNSNFPIVLGQALLQGKTLFDSVAIIHTYGYKRARPCIPSSIVIKEFFDEEKNFFKEFNALYDQSWINHYIKNGKAVINNKIIIKYKNIEYASNPLKLFKKVFYYSLPTFKVYGYFNKSIIIILLTVLLVVLDKDNFIYYVILYLTLRNILLPIYKSKSIKFINKINYRFDILILASIIIDSAKVLGIFYGLFKKKIKHYER